ncbi:MAG: hypothetical protein Q4D57_04800 [Clostridia bacterium]|nr:hypothetical protein [Clostridia bacterium]
MASIRQWGTMEKHLFKDIAGEKNDTKAVDVVNATQNPNSFRKELGEYLDQSESAFKSTSAAPILMSICGQCYLEGDPLKGLANRLVNTKVSGKSICCLLIEGKGSILASALSSNDNLKKIISHFFPEDKHDEHFEKLIKLLKKVAPQNSGYNNILSILLDRMIDGESFDQYKEYSYLTTSSYATRGTRDLIMQASHLPPSAPHNQIPNDERPRPFRTEPDEVERSLNTGSNMPPETKKIIAGLYNIALMETAKDMDEYYVRSGNNSLKNGNNSFHYGPSQFVSKTSSQRNTSPLSAQNIGEVIKHINDITTEKQRKEIQQVILSNPKIVQNIKKVLNEKTDPKLIETVKKAAEALKDPKFKSDFSKKYGITINPKK